MKLKKTGLIMLFSSLFCFYGNNAFGIEESATIREPSFLVRINEEKNAILEKASPGVVIVINKEKGNASGAIIDPKGFVITNYHVIEDAKNVVIILKNKQRVLGAIVGIDEEKDLALIKVEDQDVNFYQDHFLKFGDSDKIKIGEWAAVIGNPMNFAWTSTDGIISAVKRDSEKLGINNSAELTQTNADINPGNSGGVLINVFGEIIGIPSMIIPGLQGGSIGLGFAIISNEARNFVEKVLSDVVIEKSTEKKPIWIGMELQNLAVEDYLKLQKLVQEQRPSIPSDELNKVSLNSFSVVNVFANTPVERAGLKKNDIIYRINSREFLDLLDVPKYIVAQALGVEFTLSVLRDYLEFIEIKAMSEEKPITPPLISNKSDLKPAIWLGIEFRILRNFPEALEKELKLESGAQAYHFFIQDIDSGSPAEKAGLKIGDIIIFYDKNEAKSPEKFTEYLNQKNVGDVLSFVIIRNGETRIIEAILEALPSKSKEKTE